MNMALKKKECPEIFALKTKDHGQPAVLIVDDNNLNIDLMVEVLKDQYSLQVALDGQRCLELLENFTPDIILLDVMMPGMDGYELCRRLKSNSVTAKIPVIFITARTQEDNEAKGFACGAVDYIAKPISPPVLQARVATHIELSRKQSAFEERINRQVLEIRNSQEDAVFMLGTAGHYNDDDTGVHIWRMADYSKALAKAVLWPVEQQRMIQLAASMHDTGKIGIPDAILKKPGKLTEAEWVEMRKHSELGHRILSLSSCPLFQMAAEIALHHHERWDGSGYPHNLKGEEIPEVARIVAVADVFDALTSSRPYKEAWPVEKAFEYIADSKGHFEPRLAETFLSISDRILEIKEYWAADELKMRMLK
ncbi:HD domain-containing phosphohydrolase [Desulfovibrio sp. JC022]|uniref:HD domain-containing phosphohydrolase n=1 Tax=Desulfovibrio sp. JC022 TaxID=2593642 RepID=UPI001EF16947|nr:HD domain-containing phosphohydrolase [Desulfovibrio sp. JC022]